MIIDRRAFLRGGTAVSALALLPRRLSAAPALPNFAPSSGAWRRFEVITRIAIPPIPGPVRAWVPLPSTTADWMCPLGDEWFSNGTTSLHQRDGARMLAVAWADGEEEGAAVEVRSRVTTHDRAVDLTRPTAPVPLTMAERARYTAGTALVPTDGIVRAVAQAITAGATSDIAKIHRIYEWIVVNTFRDPETRGCGTGDVVAMLKSGRLGGKCADLNTLFVGLARASDVPARELYGIRVASSRLGYKSLGANGANITKAQHCRAEVYLDGFGWVPVDPADVRKVMLEEPPGHLTLADARVDAARHMLFGTWEANWIAFNDTREVALAGSHQPPLSFLMYPQAETVEGRRDCLLADAFTYSITARELAA
jgi:transglutaminase-like putative cysteine protease